MTVFTIGHSTRPLETFIAILKDAAIDLVADVRTVPRSRHNPQFNRETLPVELREVSVGYVHLAGLGGLRRTHPDSPNPGWRNASFRGFADYMGTEEFEKHLGGLIDLAGREVVVIMCAEAVPWRCHRSLIADALLVRGFEVIHIMGEGRYQAHKLTPWARVEGTRITYPEEDQERGERSEDGG
jgi:uncharacterized protein (DUF488 family)